jgi:hypothetical protein
MTPTKISIFEIICDRFGLFHNSELNIFLDAGHRAIFQSHSAFLDQTLRFSAELTWMRHCRFIGKRVWTTRLARGDTI